MSLSVERLSIQDFRSYARFELDIDREITILVGPNAVGKTNLVEAVQLLTTTESFRRPGWSDLVRWGAEQARLDLLASGQGRRLEIELDVTAVGKREFRVNGKPRRRLVEVAGIIHSVVFTPDDLRLVKDSAEKRRSAIDSLGSQLSRSYHTLKNQYERVVRQRNAQLKADTPDPSAMEPLDELLVETGVRFVEARRRLFDRLASAMQVAHEKVAGANGLEPRYLPSWERDGVGAGALSEEAMREHVRSKRAEERARRTTLSGPHRDELVFELDGRDARAFASQGQQRTIALAWKLAEVAVITDVAGQTPVLLLDDVMSELDEQRRRALAGFVGQAAQTIVTTTNLGYFEEDLVSRAKVVRL